MQDISNLLEFVNSLMIVDKDLIVRYSTRPTRIKGNYNETGHAWYRGKHLFEIFTDITPETSTIYKCIETGEPIIVEKQRYTDGQGNIFVTNNITWPLKNFGQVVGAVEISADVTSVGDLKAIENVVSKSADTLSWGLSSKKNISSKTNYTWDDIITTNPKMMECIRNAKLFAITDDPVMIFGETGTGKELFVEAMLSENKKRRNKYIVQNCAAIPETLFESTLFGSVKGSFTGAENRKGLFESADGGILFLDEFNSVPVHLQPKLLRVIQDGFIRPVGSNTQKKVDVKVIVALNKNPLQLIKEGMMREDLFYRFSGSMIDLTPLRERREDIMLYVDKFKTEFGTKYGKKIKGLSIELIDVFMKYGWPGNVRELKNIMDFAIKISEDEILTEVNLPAYLKDTQNNVYDVNVLQEEFFMTKGQTLKEVVENAERDCIVKTLMQYNGNVTKAAKVLGLPRQTLKFHMDKLNIVSAKQHKKD